MPGEDGRVAISRMRGGVHANAERLSRGSGRLTVSAAVVLISVLVVGVSERRAQSRGTLSHGHVE